MDKARIAQFIREIEQRVPNLKGNLVSLTTGFGTGTLGTNSETTRIKWGKRTIDKIFGRTLVKVSYTHCYGFTPFEKIRIYRPEDEETILDAYEISSPNLSPDLEHGPRGRNRHENGSYYFTYDRKRYMKAFLEACKVF
jgi:hypothetical protein